MSYDDYEPPSLDWLGVNDPWIGINVDLDALQHIVCQVLCGPPSQCGPPVAIGTNQKVSYARVYSFQLASSDSRARSVVARVVALVKPLFKTEGEVAAMDYVRNRTSLPVPKVFAYCSEASKSPVGAEWLIMEHIPGVEMGSVWADLQLPQKGTLAVALVDLYDQLYRLKAGGCGGIYHRVDSAVPMDDCGMNSLRSPRWAPLSPESLHLLRSHCDPDHPIEDGYALGPLNDISLLRYRLLVPSPSQTLPVFTSDEYDPTTRSDYDLPTREKCVELFQAIHRLYSHSTSNPTSTLFRVGPSADADANNFRFSHGDLHDGNVLIDPHSGALTASSTGKQQPSVRCDCEPENFENDTEPGDAELRAFFRTELHKRNTELFASFLGGIELRAVVHAAVDVPRPIGKSHTFLSLYHELGYWNEVRRGAFPYDANAWLHRRVDLDEIEMARIRELKKAHADKIAEQEKLKDCVG